MKKTVFITGTNRGLGKAFAEAFANAGYNLIAHARKESEEFIGWCHNISNIKSISVTPVFFDITDSQAMKLSVKDLISKRMPVNVLVNSAGVAHGGFFQMTSISIIRQVFDVNLFGAMELTQALLRYIVKCGGGSIINISSISGIDLLAGNCAYGVSKAALIAFTKTLAAECGSNGVRVNVIAPGLADTDMARQMEENAEKNMISANAMKRLAKPEEIAEAAVWLASDKASFVNGSVIRIDGGSGNIQ